MRALVLGLVATALGAVVPASVAATVEPEQAWNQIRSAKLEPTRAVTVSDVEIDVALGTLRLENGVLIPAAPVGGRTAEMVFIGEGRFRIEPTDRLEKAQLKLFTEQSALDVEITRAVLAIGDPETTAVLLEREPVATPQPTLVEQATEVFSRWVGGAERRAFGAELATLGSVVDDVDAKEFFAAWIDTEELGDFYYRFDPTESEQVTLGQFVEIEADYRDEHRIRRAIERSRRKGRYKQLRFEDLGGWDTWVSTGLTAADGSPAPGSAGVEPMRYRLDVTIDPTDERVSGTAHIEIVPDRDGKRTVTFSLYSELIVSAVRSHSGEPLPWFQSRGQVHVVLPEATELRKSIEIEIDYAGVALTELVKGKTYALIDTSSWYPRVGDVDRGTYEVTLRWPKRHEMLASGRVVDSGEQEGMRWERRTLDVPSIAFSFEIGEYDISTDRVGHIELTVGFARTGGSLDKGVKQEVIATLKEVLPYYEEIFGPYPLDYLTVATVPRGFSQGFLGFVTLTHYAVGQQRASWVAYDASFEDYSEYRKESRSETLAHELSHQWWGNKVGWSSYRDQWLSEALANFSAAVFMTHDAERKAVYQARHSKGWRGSLGRGTEAGFTVESLGPVVMGSRLNSSLGSGYNAVVYDKGSVIFTMLSQLVGEPQLAEMLKNLADVVDNSVIDTATFIRAIEKMSGLSLETFAEQFIYGTGIPEIYYTYEFVPQGDGTWIIEGEARQIRASHFKYRARKTDAGTWYVSRRREASTEDNPSAFIVPFQIALAASKDSTTTGRKGSIQTTTERGLGGKLLIKDEVSEFSVRIPKEPKDFWLDQRGQVLARFFSENHQPKRMQRYRAVELAAAGRVEEAEELFLRALGAPLIPEEELDENDLSKRQIERRSRLQDCLIQIGLSRLYLEQERDDDAMRALEAAEEMLKGLDEGYYQASRQEIQCHLDIRAGNYEAAYDVLSKWLRLDIPVREDDSMADAMRRSKFGSRSRRWGDGLDYAMLAVSAYETGHENIAIEALAEAEDRGAVMDELQVMLSGS